MKKSTLQNKYNPNYTSYSGTDIIASITIPGHKPIVIGELQTISYSMHREVTPVRTLGRINPIGFTSGQRTIAGSLIFTVFNRNIVRDLVDTINEKIKKDYSSNKQESLISSNTVMDEMPPFDVNILMQNEYGNMSNLRIKGIVIVDEGQVMSVEDLIVENTMSYMATDIEVLKDNNRGENVPPGNAIFRVGD